ncbi:hypothetical protein [Roseobacter sp. S98]|uniref:hypothetical protein n=1 Tax=Roseobacter algicola (ex Choi et al. 2025) (nom. illeg.) TaxID=3092138 RepID=UPI0035C67615
MGRRPTNNRNLPSLGRRLSELNRLENLSPSDLERIERIMREAENLDRFNIEDLIIVSDRPTPDAREDEPKPTLRARDVSRTIEDALAEPQLPAERDALKVVAGSVLERLREKFPGTLPVGPVKPGDKGAELPVNTEALAKLIRVAAINRSEGQPSVIWDDGINQLIVHPGRLQATVTEGRIRIDIPVEADGLRASMQVPFSVGSDKRKTGLVMATLDRPAGNAMVARIWGDPLIALAHGALVDVAGKMAGASGRDAENKELVVRGLTARRGQFTVETQAEIPLRRFLR